MNLVIIVAGVLGLAVAAYFLVDLTRDAVRRRQYVDILVAGLVIVAVVWFLFVYGDTFLQ